MTRRCGGLATCDVQLKRGPSLRQANPAVKVMALYQNRHLVKGLCALYARVRGEILRLDRTLATATQFGDVESVQQAKRQDWRAHAEAIARTLGLLDPTVDCAAIAPVVTTPKVGHLPYGGLRRAIVSELRRINSWTTVTDLHRAIIQRHRLTFVSRTAQAAHLQKVREALHALANATPARVERELPLSKSGTGQEQRWRLSRLFAA